MVDDAKLHQFMGQMLSDLGGAASVALVRIGDALGLYKTLTRIKTQHRLNEISIRSKSLPSHSPVK